MKDLLFDLLVHSVVDIPPKDKAHPSVETVLMRTLSLTRLAIKT